MIRSTLRDKRLFCFIKGIEFADWKVKRQYCKYTVWNDSRGFKRQCDQQDMLISSQFVKQFLSEIIFYNLKVSQHFILNYRTLFQLILIHPEFMGWYDIWPVVFLFFFFLVMWVMSNLHTIYKAQWKLLQSLFILDKCLTLNDYSVTFPA